ncbi:maltooligosyltrehalose trehalohydrolase [Ectopseudomonas guguanensis]|uniref:Malto-oligosyltrehalose trehalohydrolase n=2 Tax=Ectopseudomonas guguanensis TaxID=1198456 RepID=A0A1H0X823_9GAMM|nr:maltooligosyltrehalose trehalohydrolase [Pseudomonas guguanensis]
MYSHGARPMADGRVRFALWAPSSRQVEVELQDGGLLPMQAEDDGWFVALLQCPADTRYRYRIDGQWSVPDPASRRQVEDVHGFSQVVDHAAYSWQHREWQGRPWHETVLYELHVGLFGGFRQVIEHLPHLADLGVTALQLMPLNAFSGTRNWGYDGVLPFAPANAYGSPEELKQLIDSAHAYGLMVFVDVVYNHFGPDGNYLGVYARQFFHEERITPWGAAIDFSRPQVRDFFCENALMWLLDYRVDGLRLDAVHAIDDDDFLKELAARVRSAVPTGRQVHLVLENEHNAAHLLRDGFDAQWNDDGHNTLHALLTFENESYYADYAQAPTRKLATCLEQGFVYQGQVNRHGQPRGEPSADLPPHAFVLFLQNHDQVGNRAFGERLTLLADSDALKAATVLLLLCPMVPLLFMGEEWGSKRPFLFFTDYHDELANAVREGRRNEFADFSQFNSAHSREAIADPNAEASFQRSLPDLAPALEPEQREWLAFYRGLLQVRHSRLLSGLHQARSLGAQVLGDGAVLARWRLGNGPALSIAVNLGTSAVPLPTTAMHGERLYSLRIDDADLRQAQLPARSALVTLEPAR